MSTGSATMTTTGNSSAVAKNPLENYETITVIPTDGATAYTGLSFTVEGSIDGTNYEKLPVLDNKSGLLIAGGTSISPTDESTHTYSMMFANNYTKFRVNVSAITTGSATFLMNGSQTSPGQALYTTIAGGAGSFTNVTASGTLGVTGAATFSSTITGTSTSASALAVGANGATNPVLKVNANTASVATGVTIVGAAAAGGVAVTTISSGTNEPMTIDAKGSGTLSLNSTATGTVYLNRGALKAPVVGNTLTALGTTQNSTPTIAQLRGGVVTQTGQTGAGTVTLPTGTAISAGMALTPVAGDSFDCLFANLGGGQTLTITGDTGSTVIGTAAISSGKTALMRFINTGTNTWNVYCVASA